MPASINHAQLAATHRWLASLYKLQRRTDKADEATIRYRYHAQKARRQTGATPR